MRFLSGLLFFFFFSLSFLLVAQPAPPADFLIYQKSFKRVDDAFFNIEVKLKKEFQEKSLPWPSKYMYIRSFKYDSELEVWVKQKPEEPYRRFKTYKICALAGRLGPKRFEGDYQVPEGFYYINQFRPNSSYHLALGVNYPNASDRILSDQRRPGGEIYIHGSCVTVGCIPLTDPVIEELYVLAANTRAAGQDFIPLHVFPVQFKKDKSKGVLEDYLKIHPEYRPLAFNLEKVYYYFQTIKQLPNILINSNGEYTMLQEFTIPKRPVPPPPPTPPFVFKENVESRKTGVQEKYTDEELRTYITGYPSYAGGMDGFKKFVDDLGEDLAEFMPPGKERIFIPVEFIVNPKGKVVNVEVDKMANNEMNNLIIDRFQKMPPWNPASIKEKPLPRKLSQNIVVTAKPKVEVKQVILKEQED